MTFKSASRPMLAAGAALSALALAATGGGAIAHSMYQESVTQDAPRLSNGAPISFADLIETVSPAVVSISTETEIENPLANPDFEMEDLPPGFREFFEQFRQRNPNGEPRRARGAGSGFFISSEGLLVTNNHVVDSATSITVRTPDGEEYDAEIIGVDVATDLAVLRVEGSGFPFVEFNDGPDPRVGDWVIAMGNPFGLGGTATAGIVSASGREIIRGSGESGTYNDFLQIDAPINRGNSGGPLFDLNGEVVGVNSQIFSPTGGNVGIGFAIPSQTASNIVSAIIEDGRVIRGWLGVTIGNLDEDFVAALNLEDDNGAIVQSVVDGGPAQRFGFEAGDVIVRMNGDSVENSIELTRRIGALRANERVTFDIVRDGERRTLRVTIGERPSEDELNRLSSVDSADGGDSDGGSESGEVLGMSLTEPSESVLESMNMTASDGGVQIADIDRDSAAFRKGLRSGMVILEAGGEPVASGAAFQRKIEAVREQGEDAILLLVQIPQGRQFIALPLSEDEDD